MTDDRKSRLKALAARAGRKKEPAPDETAGANSSNSNNNSNNDNDNDNTTSEPPRKNVVFRNYAPLDKSLGSRSRDQQSNEEETDTPHRSASKRPRTRESDTTTTTTVAGETKNEPFSASEALRTALRETQRAGATDATTTTSANAGTVTSMAPKKTNWDLKRDIGDKLAKLERRTQKAIVKILKERLESEAAVAANDDGKDGSDLD